MFATLDGKQVTKAIVVIPLKGCCTADVWLADVTDISGTVTLVIGDLSLLVTVTRGGSFTGQSSYKVIGGYGGWMKTVKPQEFAQSVGLKASVVLSATAREVGEKISVTNDRTLGQKFVREQAPAARYLAMLADQWWIGPDGVTVVGPRPTPTIVSSFEVLKAELGKGRIEIATDNPAAWIPGSKFSSPTIPTQSINTIVHKVSPTALRTEVWTSG